MGSLFLSALANSRPSQELNKCKTELQYWRSKSPATSLMCSACGYVVVQPLLAPSENSDTPRMDGDEEGTLMQQPPSTSHSAGPAVAALKRKLVEGGDEPSNSSGRANNPSGSSNSTEEASTVNTNNKKARRAKGSGSYRDRAAATPN